MSDAGLKRLAACHAKQVLKTFEAAQAVTQRLRSGASGRRGGVPYRCRFCAGWHVGGGNPSRKANKA